MAFIVHSIHFPISARSFIEPMVAHLNDNGLQTELWLENHPRHGATVALIRVSKRFVESDLSLNPAVFLRRLLAYRRQLRCARPEVLHVHQTRASIIPLLAARFQGVKLRIYHNHGLPYLGYRGPLRWALRGLERINIRLATQVLFVSHSNLEAARRDQLLGPGEGAVLANGSAVGIDFHEFSPSHFYSAEKAKSRAKLNLADRTFVLGYVGRPVKRKGFACLLRAWEKSGLSPQTTALLIGGCTAEECETAVGYPIKGVRALGYLNDLREFYASCNAVALPSDHEGFPYSLLEGAAAGLALIGTDIPGIRCAIRPGETGLLVPARDEDALCKVIRLLAADKELCARLGSNARRRAEREFDRKMVLQGLLEFYNGILGGGGADAFSTRAKNHAQAEA